MEPAFGWRQGIAGFKLLNDLFHCARHHFNLRITCRSCEHTVRRVCLRKSRWLDGVE